MAKNCPWLSVPAQLSMIDDDDEPPIDLFLFIISVQFQVHIETLHPTTLTQAYQKN